MKHLADVASIRLGYPFRGEIKAVANGPVQVVQIKNIHEIKGIDWSSLISTELTGRKNPDYLKSGDILFTARGSRTTAIALDGVPEPTVCSPHLYQISLKTTQIRSAYLAWYINQKPAGQHFARFAEGSRVMGIRRSMLEALPVPLPSLEEQDRIIALDQLVKQEYALLTQRMANSQTMMNAIAFKLRKAHRD